MTDNKKELEREELHKAIWGISDDLRGSVDGWDFKQYVLGITYFVTLEATNAYQTANGGTVSAVN